MVMRTPLDALRVALTAGRRRATSKRLGMYHGDIGSASITLATEAIMAALTVRNLSDEVRDRLRERAAKNGRSMEAEVRAILEAACAPRATMSIEEVQAWVDRLYSGRKPKNVVEDFIAERRREALRENGDR